MEKLWVLLDNKFVQLFGEECGAALIWIFVGMTLRLFFSCIRIDQYIPCGIFFATPLTLQVPLEFSYCVIDDF
jgi:hypothetical protein